MVDLHIYQPIHANIEAFDRLFPFAFGPLTQIVYFLLNAAVDEIKGRGSDHHYKEKDGRIKPDDKNKYQDDHQAFADYIDKRDKDPGSKIHGVKMDLIQEVGGAFVDDLFEWLVDNMVKSAFRKILDQLRTELVYVLLYQYCEYVLDNKEKYHSQDQCDQKRRFFFETGLFINEP
jgi:hypothetical protein